jgi:sulfite exporter TauE/SafE
MGALEGIAVAVVAIAAVWRGIALLRRPEAGERLSKLGKKPPRAGFFAALSGLWPRRGLGLGLATGIMPCGLLLPAWALSAGTASAPVGAAVMAVFWAATLPGLLLPLAGRRLLARVMQRLPTRAYGLLWCALGLWIAARPLLVASGVCHR